MKNTIIATFFFVVMAIDYILNHEKYNETETEN